MVNINGTCNLVQVLKHFLKQTASKMFVLVQHVWDGCLFKVGNKSSKWIVPEKICKLPPQPTPPLMALQEGVQCFGITDGKEEGVDSSFIENGL